jgi:predicted enzyme related to lactoylglutathione lyase
MSTINQYFWYELMTSDHEAAQGFYSSVVGWKLTPFAADGHPYTVLEIDGGRGVGGVMPMPPGAAEQGMKPHWVGYVHVADIDAAVERLKAAGGSLYHGPDPIPTVGRFAVVADPQGTTFNLLQPDSTEEMPALAMGTPGGVDWHELHGTDWAGSLEFYASQFGWSGTGQMDMGPLGAYQFFAMEPAPEGADCGTTRGAMYNDKDAPRPYWLFYVSVGDIDAAAERVKANGGTVLQGPAEVPGGNWVINARDPQGAIFALVGNRT